MSLVLVAHEIDPVGSFKIYPESHFVGAAPTFVPAGITWTLVSGVGAAEDMFRPVNKPVWYQIPFLTRARNNG